MDDGDASYGWVAGVALNMMGNVAVNLGTNLIKLGHDTERAMREKQPELAGCMDGVNGVEENDELEDEELAAGQPLVGPSMPHQPPRPLSSLAPPMLRKLGVAVFGCGSLIIFSSYSLAAQSLLAAIASVQFISNVFFGALVLQETVTRRVKLATVVIVCGNILVVLFSSREGSTYTAADLLELYDSRFRAFGAVLLVAVLILHGVYRIFRYSEKQGKPLPHSDFIVPALYSCVAAMIGTQSVVQAKCLSTLIHQSMAGDNQLGHFFTWIVLTLWGTGTVFWLHRVNRALSVFDGLFIIPILQAFFVIWTIIIGGMYFKEFDRFTVLQATGFTFGVSVVVFGVFLLAPQSSTPAESRASKGCSLSESPATEMVTHTVAVAPALQSSESRSTTHRFLKPRNIPVIASPFDPTVLGSLELLGTEPGSRR